VPSVMDQDTESGSRLFRNLNSRFKDVVNFAAVDKNGYFFASGKPFDRNNPPSVKGLDFFKELAAGSEKFIMTPHTGPISSVNVTGIVIPHYTPSGEFNGLIGTSIKYETLENLWTELFRSSKFQFIVTDREQTNYSRKLLMELGYPMQNPTMQKRFLPGMNEFYLSTMNSVNRTSRSLFVLLFRSPIFL
jgi:hypothetical protein